MVTLFNNTQTVIWINKMESSSNSPIAGILVLSIAILMQKNHMGPISTTHISGYGSIMYDISSCPKNPKKSLDLLHITLMTANSSMIFTLLCTCYRKQSTIKSQPPLFRTQGKLILDISIASYSITPFSILFIYFIRQVKPRLETIQGAPPPHQMVGNIENGNPLISASPRDRKGGNGKRSAVDPTAANTGIFLPFFFPFVSDENATYLSPTDPPWCLLPAQGAAAATPPARRLPGISIGTLNIWSGRGFGLAHSIWTVERVGPDVILLTKTKI